MDYYHIWCNLQNSKEDEAFCNAVKDYLNEFIKLGNIETFTLTRRKLGFGPPELGEFHIVIHTKDMTALEETWKKVAQKQEPILSLHREVYSRVTNFKSALYRDFPDEF